jgi:hypothetical protein
MSATTSTVSARTTAPAGSFSWTVKDAMAMTGRNLLSMRRVPQVGPSRSRVRIT